MDMEDGIIAWIEYIAALYKLNLYKNVFLHFCLYLLKN